MDAKIKSILQTLNNQIDSNELATALKADSFEGEYALSEDGLSSIINQTKGLLSTESAVNNSAIIEKISKDLYPKHMKSALAKVEEKLRPILDKLGVDYSKYEFISDAIGDIPQKLESLGSGDNKALIESLNEDLRKSKEVAENLKHEFEEQLKKRDQEILTDKILQKFKSKVTEKQWADAYNLPGVKDALIRQLWDSVNAKAHLKLSEDGEILPMQKEFPDKELYNGNKVETFQSLLEPLYEPYLKKSDPPQGDPKYKKPEGKPLSEIEQKRLAEYNRMKAREV